MLLLFDELLKFPGFVLMRSVFCANIAKIDQSGPHVKKKCIFIFEGFSDLRIILNFFFFLVVSQCRLLMNTALPRRYGKRNLLLLFLIFLHLLPVPRTRVTCYDGVSYAIVLCSGRASWCLLYRVPCGVCVKQHTQRESCWSDQNRDLDVHFFLRWRGQVKSSQVKFRDKYTS